MNQTAIFWPMLAHVVLVLASYVVLGNRRGASIKTGEAKISQFKVRHQEPESSVNAANNIQNQFELPMLFHAVCICLYITVGANLVAVLVAWLFVLARYGQAYVHLTTNKLKHRNIAFRVGLLFLTILWVLFALHIAGLI